MMILNQIDVPVRELLDQDFLVSQVLRVKTRSESGVEWLTEGEVLREKSVCGSMGVSFRNGSGYSLNNLSLNADGRIMAEASLNTSQNLKFTAAAEDGRQEPGKPLQSSGKFGVEYCVPSLQLSADIDVVNGPLIRGGFLWRISGFQCASEALINSHFDDNQYPELKGLNFGINYKTTDWNAFAMTEESVSTIKMGYLHHVSPALDICGHIQYRLKTNFQKLTIGSKFRLDEQSIIKFKLDSTATLAASFSQKVHKYINIILAAEVNIQHWSAESHKFGFGLFFG